MRLTESDKKSIEENGGYYRTVMGRKVFIKEGQSVGDAMKASGKFGKDGKPNGADSKAAGRAASALNKVAEKKSARNEALSKVRDKIQKQKVERKFREQLNQVQNGTFDKNSHLQLGETPAILIKKAGLPKLPLMMSYKKAYLAMNNNDDVYVGENYHGLGVGVLSSLPTALHKPKDLFRHKTNPKRIAVVVELKDGKGRNVLTSIEFDTVSESKGKQSKSNNLITAFGANERYLRKIKAEWEKIE